MEADKNSYKQILKATSLFGGVQFVNIIGSIIKTKVAAVLIGVAGVGVFGVLSSTLNFIVALTRCGLDLTLVKEIAAGEKDDIPRKVSLTRQLTFVTGIIGSVIVVIFSPWLSLLAFSNKTYTLFFITISVAVLFNQLTVGNMAILQGLKSLKRLAKVITFSGIISLIPTVTIYYFFGESGIPWVIVVTAFTSFIISKYYVNQLKIKKHLISFSDALADGKNIIKSGFYLSMASIITLFVGFIIQIYITNTGGIKEVGLYNAGFVLINSYVAVFFSALSKDFFPRLSEVSRNNELVNKIVNEQAYMLLLLITPIIIIFLVFKSFIVSLLYSKEFLPILGMITYGILSTSFKAISWSMGFILIAKDNSKLYLMTEIVSNALLLISIVIGYNMNGLTGIGLGYLVYHIIDLLFIKFIVTKNYNFYFDASFNKLFYLCVFQFALMLGLLYIENKIIQYITMALVVLFSISITFIKLNNHFNLIDLIKNKK